MKINQFLFAFLLLFLFSYSFSFAQDEAGVGCDACQPLGFNILVNGDFEQLDTGFSSDLTSDNTCGTNTYNIETGLNTNCIGSIIPDHTIGDGNYMILNVAQEDDGVNPITTDTTVWSQSPLLLDDQEYVFSFWVHNLSPFDDIVEPQLEVVIDGVSVGTTTSINDTPLSNGGWQKFCFNYFSDSESIKTIEINQIYPDGQMFELTSFALDDISMAPQYEDAIECELIVQYVDGTTEARKDSIRSRFDIMVKDSCVCGDIDLWLVNQFPMVVNGDTIVDIENLRKGSKDTLDIQDIDFNYTTRTHDSGYASVSKSSMNLQRNYEAPNSDDSCAIVVAVIDTGVQPDHDRFNTEFPGEVSIWEFTNPCPEDATEGYNFFDNDNNPNDNGMNGHGTHVAGIIAEQFSTNISGDEYRLEIMPVKAQGADGEGTLFKVICSTLFATDNGADIINMSFGYRGDSTTILYNAIDRADAVNDVIVVCSAGNDARNNDKYGHYPSNFNNDNLIAVAATDSLGEGGLNSFTPYSCFGAESVDIAVFGSIESSIPIAIDNGDNNPDGYGFLQGTSMAAPQIAAAAAVGKAYLNDAASIKSTILNSGNPMATILDTVSLTNNSFDFTLFKQNITNNPIIPCITVPNTEYLDIQEELNISPNPVSDILRIQYEGDENIESINIYDIQGKSISRVRINGENQIDVNKLPKGVYILEVSLGKQQIRKKFIKM